MDLNKLREQLEKSRPVKVTRTGRLKIDENDHRSERPGASRLKRHTFADTGRAAQDHFDLARRTGAAAVTWQGKPALRETITTNFGVPFTFVMVVPDGYPAVPPKVYCTAPEVPKKLAYHVYSDGALCLMQPWEWSPSNTLLDVRNWACEWAFNVVPKLLADQPWMSPEHRVGT